MAESSKKGTKPANVASQAAAAVGPIKDRATEIATAAAAAAGPRVAHTKERAVGMAERAGAVGAKGVNVVAEGLDRATGGRFAKQISSVSSRVEERLHPDKITPTPRTAGPDAAQPPAPESSPESS